MIVWRLVLEKIATLAELETHWSLDDAMKANAYLDMRADIAQAEAKKAYKAGK